VQHSFDPGRALTLEEIAKIAHTIRPIERVRKHYFGQQLFIDAEIQERDKLYRRLETIDK